MTLDAAGHIEVEDRTTRTNLPGCSPAVTSWTTSTVRAVTAAGTGCSAALDAERYLVALADEAAAASRVTHADPAVVAAGT